MSMSVTPEAGGSLVATETRVVGTSPETTRRFRRYWFVIRWGSGALRGAG